jgi:hypothetical protein
MAFQFWQTSSSRTKRILTIGAFFVVAFVVTSVGVLTPLSVEDANSINQDIEQLRENISVQYVFGNNLMLCLPMFIPFVGPIFGLWVMYNTGIAIAAETIAASPQVSPLLTFLMLFIFPFTWMEFISYSTGFAESVWLIRRGMQGRGRREIKNAATLIAIVAVILLFAAIIEVALILALNG